MRTLLAGVAAAALIGGSAMAQHIVLVPQGQGPAGQQQFILVPIPQDQAEMPGGQQQQGAAQQGAGQQGTGQQGTGQQGAGQQGTGQQGMGQQGMGQQGTDRQGGQQQALQQQVRDRAEAMAMDLYRRGYQRGVADAQSAAGPPLDPAAMEQIGRELFERGYMLGLMQGRAHAGQQQAAAGQQAGTGQQAQGTQQGQAGQQTAQAQTGQQEGQAQTGQQEGQQAVGQAGGQLVTGQVGVTPQTDVPEATIAAEQSQQYGQYLVDDNGRAVYMFTADKQGQGDAEKAVSNCYDACAEAWPPVLTRSTPVEAMGPVKSDLLGTIERKDGMTQVTYNGWPLYYYVKDQGQTEVTGQDVHGFGGEWYLLKPEGEKVAEG